NLISVINSLLGCISLISTESSLDTIWLSDTNIIPSVISEVLKKTSVSPLVSVTVKYIEYGLDNLVLPLVIKVEALGVKCSKYTSLSFGISKIETVNKLSIEMLNILERTTNDSRGTERVPLSYSEIVGTETPR